MEEIYYLLAVLGAIPTAWAGLWFIAKRTKTDKDDKFLETIEKR